MLVQRKARADILGCCVRWIPEQQHLSLRKKDLQTQKHPGPGCIFLGRWQSRQADAIEKRQLVLEEERRSRHESPTDWILMLHRTCGISRKG